MLCDDCKNKEANVHVTKIINGKKEEKNLCEDCAKKNEKANFENNFSMPNFLTSLLEGNLEFNMNYKEDKRCPQCNATYEDYKRTGRLGCGACYETFSDMLVPLIRKIQGSTKHGGKIPKKSGAAIRLKNKLKASKAKLQQLIMQEEFEEAAKIRDEIRTLEGEINNGI